MTERSPRVLHLAQPGVVHREDPEFVDRAEAILDRANDPEMAVALALEIEHRVDHVLEHPRAGQRAFLGDVSDQK